MVGRRSSTGDLTLVGDLGQATGPHRYDDWHEIDWGPITNQDYANMAEVQIGMKSRGFDALRLNPRQEGNLLHMHRVIDQYLQST